jgi:hypothetical protein
MSDSAKKRVLLYLIPGLDKLPKSSRSQLFLGTTQKKSITSFAARIITLYSFPMTSLFLEAT